MDGINKKNIIGMAVYKDLSKKLLGLKTKSADEIKEEAYTFLELDEQHKVDMKKKGVSMPFNVHDKDNYVHEKGTKMRHFS